MTRVQECIACKGVKAQVGLHGWLIVGVLILAIRDMPMLESTLAIFAVYIAAFLLQTIEMLWKSR